MKYLNVRGGVALLIGSLMVAGLSNSADAGWGHRHASYGGSSGVYAVGYGSSGAYSSYGSSGYASSGGSSGYATYSSHGSSGYAASHGSSGYYGSSGRPTLRERWQSHVAAKRARHAARRASYGSSGYYASSGGSSGYSSSGGSSGYSSVSHGSSGGSSGSYGSVGAVYSNSVSYGGTARASSTTGYYSASKSIAAPASVVSRVSGDAVYLTVAVPSDAKVFVNGKATKSTGRVREFVSRGLKPGSSYKFAIRAELESTDGQMMSESKQLVVQAGAREQVQFAFADQAKPIETAVTVNVPEGAEVFLSGNPTSATGDTRTFRTSKLMPGESWDDYQIEVRHDGQVKNKSIRLIAGDRLQLTFAFDNETSPDKLAAR